MSRPSMAYNLSFTVFIHNYPVDILRRSISKWALNTSKYSSRLDVNPLFEFLPKRMSKSP
jgi:hypothetical protein